ncbi:MAG: hypothetical protein LCH58_14935 [Bacteroidetes bacterium]|nr:hypothetical protein [Bacteroidota bacterium]
MKHFLLVVLLLIAGVVAHAQSGTFDNTFSADGKAIIHYSFPYLSLGDALLQNDKLIVGGGSLYNNNAEAVILRYNSNGTPDVSFGEGGMAKFNFSTGSDGDELIALDINANGQLFALVSEADSFRVLKLQSNGAIDGTFGGAVGARFSLASTYANDMLVLNNGKLLVLASISGVPTFIRFNNNGSLDSSFGIAGLKAVALQGLSSTINAYSMALQSDGKIVIAGSYQPFFNSDDKLIVARFTTNGDADISFDNDGWLEALILDNTEPSANKVMVDKDGRILVGGLLYDTENAFIETTKAGAVWCFLNNGQPDESFGVDGVAKIGEAGDLLMPGFIAQQGDGKYVLGAAYRNGADFEFAAIRLTNNGLPDLTFDTDGVARKNMGNGFDYGAIPMIQTDGKVVLLGGSIQANRFVLGVARFNSNGSRDDAYNSTGQLLQQIGEGMQTNASTAVKSIALLADNAVIATGSYENGFGQGGFVTKYSSAGVLDESFGEQGYASVSAGVADGFSHVATADNGSVIAVGTSVDLLKGASILVAKFTSSGQPDMSFGTFGKVLIDVAANDYAQCLALAVHANGEIAISIESFSFTSLEESFYLIKLNANGSLNTSFDTDGIQPTPIAYNKMVYQPADGKLVISGAYDSGLPQEGYNITTNRLLSSGLQDPSFNNGNPLITHFSPENDEAVGLYITSAGKILLGVNAFNAGLDRNFGIARYNSNGTPDSSFSGDGKSTFGLPYNGMYFSMNSTGKMIVAGKPFFSNGYLVTAINDSGTINTNFGNNGTATVNVSGINTNEEIFEPVLQPDGNILLVGEYQSSSNGYVDGFIARVKGLVTTVATYTFSGNGNWSVAGNWAGGQIPPNPLPAGTQVVIDHIAGGIMILDVPVTLQSGAKIILANGKTFRVNAPITVPAITQQ